MTQPCATITDVPVLDGDRVEVTFWDGVRGVVDLANRVIGRGGYFGPLETLEFFRQVSVDCAARHDHLVLRVPTSVQISPPLRATGEAGPPPEAETVTL